MRYAPCGGVRPAPLSQSQIVRAKAAIAGMPQAVDLDSSLEGETVVVAGNSPTLDGAPWEKLRNFPVIGCNRALLKPATKYTHIVVADREPYCQERDAGRLETFASGGGILLGSDSLFDPTVFLRATNWQKNPYRLAQPPPDFRMFVYKIGTLGKQNAQAKRVVGQVKGLQDGLLLNFNTFAQKLESCLNIVGSMIQSAMIMGAQRVIFVGLELVWPRKGKSHSYGDGRSVGAYPQNANTVEYILTCLRWARKEMARRGVDFANLSPVKDCPFAKVFGTGTL